MPNPKKIDLSKIDPESYEGMDDLIKVLMQKEKARVEGDGTAHANDHRSSHTNRADA